MARISKQNKSEYKVIDFYPNNLITAALLDSGEEIEVDIKVVNKNVITERERNFIFALCREISNYLGYETEHVRLMVQTMNSNAHDYEIESLSNCSTTYAGDLIKTIVNFCLTENVPIPIKLLESNEYRFDEKQTYYMILKRKCCICGGVADIHHIDTVGMGNNRKEMEHTGKRVIPLCRKHHTEAHTMSSEEFIDKHHITPIVVDEKLNILIKKGAIKRYE